MAAEAPVAVLVRHGPNKLAQIIKWSTDTDRFEPGQWLKGQIASQNVRLSPDGSLMVYSATDHGRNKRRLSAGGTPEWTAVSKPPYLTALCLWFHHGPTAYKWKEAYFESNSVLRLGFSPLIPDRMVSTSKPPLEFKSQSDEDSSDATSFEWHLTDRDVLNKLFLDLTKAAKSNESDDWLSVLLRSERCFAENLPRFSLTKVVDGIRLIRNEFWGHKRLDFRYHIDSNDGLDLDGADWADFDQRGRLVFTRDGKLFAATKAKQEWQVKELADFKDNQFEEVVAPDWAKTW